MSDEPGILTKRARNVLDGFMGFLPTCEHAGFWYAVDDNGNGVKPDKIPNNALASSSFVIEWADGTFSKVTVESTTVTDPFDEEGE